MSSLSRNLSHRYLIKQKTKQLFYYPIHTHKTTNNLKSKHVLTDVSLTSNRKQLVEQETSIYLDDQLDTSLGVKVRSASAGARVDCKKILLKGQRINFGLRRSSQGKTKSTQAISKLKSPTLKLRPSFSLKKYLKPHSTPTPSPQTSSTCPTQPLRCQQKYKKTAQKQNESETRIQSKNLKKTSTIRMKQNMRTNGIKVKVKVIDPFEKRRKLDIEFQDESVINKNVNNQSLFIDTWNKKEFMDLLQDLV